MGFRLINFVVHKGAADGSEADNVVCVRFHINNHRGKEEEVADCVVIILCAAWLDVVMLCGV